MSELKTNKISTNDQNNVAIDNALGLKSYDTAGRDALTSVAGDMIYNTTTTKAEYYTWFSLGRNRWSRCSTSRISFSWRSWWWRFWS